MNKRKSSKEKKLKGNPGCRSVKKEPSLCFDAPDCPAKLNDGAKVYWSRYSPYLVKTKQLNILSADLFAEYCNVMSAIDDIELSIQECCKSRLQVNSIMDSAGRERIEYKEAALSQMNRQYKRLALDYGKQFHLTPESMKGYYNFDDDEEKDELI
jgi:phage terminase small subunit